MSLVRTLARAAAAFPALVLAPALCAAPGEVWTVGASGADFTQIQQAVDVANHGDVILVKPGSYAAFQIDDRGLTVVAETAGSVTVAGPSSVRDLAEGRRVALIDLTLVGDGEHGLVVSDNQGSVRVRGGTYRVLDKSASSFEPTLAAMLVTGSADVALRSVTLIGGDGRNASTSPFGGPGSGHDGLRTESSGVALYHCTLTGGDGGSDPIEEGYSGGWGGHGLQQSGGFAHVVNSELRGGHGGNGGEEDGIPPFGNRAGNGGHGGHGVHMLGGAVFGVGTAHAQLLAVDSMGGEGGVGGAGFWEPSGQPGEDGQGVGLAGDAFPLTLPGPVVRLVADGLWRPGTPETLQVMAKPGDFAVLAISPKGDFTRVSSKQGVMLLGGMPALKPLGIVPAGGVLTMAWPNVVLPAGWEGLTLELQVWAGPLGGPAVLSGPSTTVIVDPAF